jgi:hypothetical protein
MKSTTKILSLLFFHAFISFAQQTDSHNIISTNDSLKINIISNSLTKMQIKFDEFELHRDLNNMKMNVSIDGDPQTVWLRTSLAIGNTNNPGSDNRVHYLSPLYTQYIEDSKFNPVRYILGMAQVGAVGYLAYKHIKKYGFLK